MMNDKILSIIIPAYNVEAYIQRCLDSITLNIQCIDYLDIIVINDGSKDSTLELAKMYEKQHPQSVKVIDKTNGGWGSGINKGIEEACGKYVKTLDSDDWFNSENLDEFVSLLKRIDVDMVLTSLSEVNSKQVIREKTVAQILCNKEMSIDDYLRSNNYDMNAPIHAITYKTSVLKDSGFKVFERYYGDLDYIITPLLHVHTIFLSHLNIYQYYLGRDGQSVSISGYRTHIDDYLNVCQKTIDFWQENKDNISTPLRKFMLNTVISRIRWAYTLLMSPLYCGNEPESRTKLSLFDDSIKRDKVLYKLTNRISKKFIPWVFLWRKTKINILRFSQNK